MIISVGHNVKYSGKFLRSIGALTDEIGQLRGKVKEIRKLGDLNIAVIDWNDGTEGRVNVKNLHRADKFEPFD
jgi:hypothetical protein